VSEIEAWRSSTVLAQKVITHDTATAAFDEAASSLEELGFVHEVTLDGVVFSRSEPDAGKYDPGTKIGAAHFLGLAKRDSRTRLLGSSDRRCCLQGSQSLPGIGLP
jgi:hypothetical protein